MRIWYKFTKRILLIAIVILFVLMLLLLGMTNFDQNMIWFSTLNTPGIKPPGWTCILVCITIYTMVTISVIMILGAPKKDEKHKNISIGLFIINGILNAMYSILFFGMKSIVLAFVSLPLLIASIVLLIMCIYRFNKIAAYLLVPYLIWVLFATVLTGTMLYMN